MKNRFYLLGMFLLVFVITGCGGKKESTEPTALPPTSTPIEATVPPSPQPTNTNAAAAIDEAACAALVETAYTQTSTACEGIGDDQACYGNVKIEAEPNTLNFNKAGDMVNVADIQSLRLSSMDAQTNEWGISLMRLQAAETAQYVDLLLFGNVQIQTAGKAESGVQAFTFQSGVNDRPCDAAPDSGIMVQTPKGVGEITLLVNEVVIDLGSTAYLQAQPGADMDITTVEGQATVTSNGTTVVAPAGTRTGIPLDASGVADGAPSEPEPYEAAPLQPLPVVLLDEPVVIAPPAEKIPRSTTLGDARDLLTLGGQLDPTHTDNYFFTAEAGQLLYLNALVPDSGCCFSWTLFKPDGSSVFSSGFSAPDYREAQAEVGGRYRLMVESVSDFTGSYEGQIGVAPEAQTFSINVGDTISPDVPAVGAGKLDAVGAQDIYTFTAQAGQSVYLEPISENGVDQLHWTLADQDGTALFTSLVFGDGADEEKILEKGGSYTLTVDGQKLFTGEYSLKLWDVPPPQSFTITLDQAVSSGVPTEGAGNIETVGAQDVYTFTAEAGQPIFMDVPEGDCCDFWWTLADEGGSQLFSTTGIDDTERVLEKGGTYTLTVDGLDMKTGTYSFQIMTVSPADSFEVPSDIIIAPDVPGAGAGNIEKSGSQDIYSFSMEQGQIVFVTKLEETVSPSGLLYFTLQDEDGTAVFRDQAFNVNAVQQYTLVRGGVYKLIVNGYADTTGTYRLRISRDPFGAPPLEGDFTRQWASSATASTQYSDPNWSANQAIGEPNTFQCGDITSAWASSSAQGKDTLELHYDQPVIPVRIDVYQTYNPGSITQVQLIAVSGEIITLPNSADAPGNTLCPGVFTLEIPDFNEPVNGIILHFDQTIGGSWNEIDAVELIGTGR